jgi:acyl-CoA synthetase (AMP-forming)/AMP-acid ligase II
VSLAGACSVAARSNRRSRERQRGWQKGRARGRPGAAPDVAAIRAALGTVLARYKLPKLLHILPALPRNAMGKVQKAALRAQFGG